jgi:protein-tyrosine phosphatase
VATKGLRFVSAGLAAGFGEPASPGAVSAAAEMGCNLDGHVSQPLQLDALPHVERVYCMTAAQVDRLRSARPDLAAQVTTLRPDGEDLTDPFGMDVALYRQTRDEIARALADRWPEIAALREG